MASSDVSTPDAALRKLGRLLSGTEAKDIADRLADGDTLSTALQPVSQSRRTEVRSLLVSAGLGTGGGSAIAVLRAIEGARSTATAIESLWTLPGHLAQHGRLTSSVAHLVDGARQSVVCSTFNFQKTSALWDALHRAAGRPELSVRVYVDTKAADTPSNGWTPTSTQEIAEHLRPAVVLRTKAFDGSYVRNHAKFLAIDHRFLLVTSANFSWSAEQGNVEFGVRIDNPSLVEAVERELHMAEDALYEVVRT